ncbi:MAG: hypothetical protein GYB53_25080 [Rhodobacteraceae bacterium]|nr:hypothetical protein [Paracoccaceae bacterium]MBR9821948.1 hypothetical protein [Paracoccaceae bacterium]
MTERANRYVLERANNCMVIYESDTGYMRKPGCLGRVIPAAPCDEADAELVAFAEKAKRFTACPSECGTFLILGCKHTAAEKIFVIDAADLESYAAKIAWTNSA